MSAFRARAEEIDVSYVAELARLDLTAEEKQRFQAQLRDVLAYVRQLEEVNVEGVEPTAHAAGQVNVFRPDEARPSEPPGTYLANAPSHRGGLFLVPKIVE